MDGFELLTDIDTYKPFSENNDRREQKLWDTISGRPPAHQALPSATHLAYTAIHERVPVRVRS